MINKQLRKTISFMLILLMMLSVMPTSIGITMSHYIIESDSYDNVELLMPLNFNPNDVFDIYRIPGAYYRGYAFQLVEYAVFDYTLHNNISAIFAPKHVYLAASLEDISNAVDTALILFIEPNYMIPFDRLLDDSVYVDDMGIITSKPQPRAFAPVNDPDLYRQWGLEVTRGHAAWTAGLSPEFPAGSSRERVVIAVVDTGLNSHEDINERFIRTGWNYVHNNTDTRDNSPRGHGTSATSVIAATRDNGIFMASLAYRAYIVPLRIWAGADNEEHSFAYAQVVYDAVNVHGADVLFMNLACPNANTAIFANAIAYAMREHNALVVAAAGSWDGTAIHYPAGFSNVIGVGAFNRDGVRVASPTNSSIFISAPAGILAANNVGGYNPSFGGSSAATPYIASLAALAKGYNPDITQAEFADILRDSAIRRRIDGQLGRNNQYGYGRIDVGLFVYNLTGEDFFDFTDVEETHWARGYVWANARYGIMHGRREAGYFPGSFDARAYHGSHNDFWPGAPMWRLEFPMALGRLHELNGGNIHWMYSAFSDVCRYTLFPYNYNRFVHWASHPDRDIVRGIGDNLFNPGGEVTREQAAAMLYRFARFLARDCAIIEEQMNDILANIPGDARTFLRASFPNDYQDVSDWAVDYMAWAVSAELIRGRDFSGVIMLAPEGIIPRAEGAALLHRYRYRFLNDTFLTEIDRGGVIPGDGTPGGTTTNSWSTLNFNPGFPATIEPTHVPVGDNLTRLLSWFQGGALANGPAREGYQFLGWYMDAGFTAPLTEDFTMPSTPLTLYARWVSEGPPPTHVVIEGAFGWDGSIWLTGGVLDGFLMATVHPLNANQAVTWSSSHSFIVVNQNGHVFVCHYGSVYSNYAIITATAQNGIVGTFSVPIHHWLRALEYDETLDIAEDAWKIEETVGACVYACDDCLDT